jgi:hypothetical protein
MSSILLMLAVRTYRRTGAVTLDGRGVSGVRIEYTADGKACATSTDIIGNYGSTASEGSVVTVTGVAKDGFAVAESLPVAFTVSNSGKARADFTLRRL